MFSLIGLGEQAGSGIPRIVKNWESLSYRLPELWEDESPNSTVMRLRMTSLLPEDSLEFLNNLFDQDFLALSALEKLALVTAHVEDYISNRRLQAVSREHPHDITKMLQRLVAQDFLVSDGVRRATTYSLNNTGLNSSTSSTHNEDSSTHWKELLEQAQEIRNAQRTTPEVMRSTIIQLCATDFLTSMQLGTLLARDPKGLRDRFLTPMYKERLLQYRYPSTPNHENQAYKSDNSQ